MPRLITADQIDFGPDKSTPVVSDTLRFVIPVPVFEGGGEPLVPPDGAEAFTDWEGKPITGRGVVFYNPDDRCYQAAHGDGSEVVIFGLITRHEARQLAAEAAKLAADPNRLTLAQFKAPAAVRRRGYGPDRHLQFRESFGREHHDPGRPRHRHPRLWSLSA